MHVNRVLKYAAHKWARPFFNIIIDTVFPAKCLVCGRLFEPAATTPGMGEATDVAAGIPDTAMESTTTRKAGGLDFNAVGGKRQGRDVPHSLRVEPGAESRRGGIWKTQSHRLLISCCCPDCVSFFRVISSPICSCCGIMFKSRQGRDHLCGDCITQPKEFRIARAAVAYDPQFMAVMHRFKYAGKIQLAGPLGGLLRNAYGRYWDAEKVDLILPVPLHSAKFRKRGFNQSYLLIRRWKSRSASVIGEKFDIPVNTDVLIRSKATVSQTGLGRQQRLKNIKGAFSVMTPEKVIDKKVLLVDDVYTTGATVNECARMLLKAGAERVDVLTVARAM